MPLSSILSRSEAREQAARWVVRRNGSEYRAEDQRAFLVWINASEENRRAYAEAEALWESLRGLDDVAGQRLAEARAFLARKRRGPVRRRLAAAAGILLVASLAWWFDPLSHLDDRIYRTAQGRIRAFDLADGSRLELDTASEARVHYSRRERAIRLVRGRAVFTVVHGDPRHFEVYAGQVKVRDIGTRFDVRHLADGIAVAVLEGEVEVSGGTNAAPIVLRRGQRVDYARDGDAGSVQFIDAGVYSSWRDGRLVFNARPLREVLEELGRYQPTSLAVSAPRFLDTRVSGVFSVDDLPQAMQTIAAALPVRIVRTGEHAWRIDPR